MSYILLLGGRGQGIGDNLELGYVDLSTRRISNSLPTASAYRVNVSMVGFGFGEFSKRDRLPCFFNEST